MKPTQAMRLFIISIGALSGCAAGQKHDPIPQFPPAPVYAADHAYTLDELVDLSVYRNSSLDVSRYEAEAAQGLVDQVKALWLPALRYDFAATAYNNDMNYRVRAYHVATINVPITSAYNLTNNFALTQIVSSGGKRTSGLKQAKMLAALTKIDVQRQQDLVAYSVATFYQLVCLTTQVDTALDDALRRIRVFRQVAHNLNQRGSLRASDLDALEADLFVTEMEQLQLTIRASREQAYCALKKFVGLDPAEPLLLREMALPPPVTPLERLSVVAAIVKGFLHRPENQEVNLFARIRAEQVRFAKAMWAPNIAIFGNEIDITGNGNTILNSIDGLIAGIVVDVPIYDPARRGRLREALGGEQAALAFQREVEQLLTLDIHVSAVDVQRAAAALPLARQAQQAATEHAEAARQAYSRELVPASNVVIAIGLDAVGKVGYLQSLYCFHNARANLKRATAERDLPYGY